MRVEVAAVALVALFALGAASGPDASAQPISPSAATDSAIEDTGDAIQPQPPRRTPPRPRPLELPKVSLDDRLRISVLAGVRFGATRWNYDSAFSTSGRSIAGFEGARWTQTAALTATVGLTLPGVLRRITVGTSLGVGGPALYERAPIPDDAAVPFDRDAFFRAFTPTEQSEPAWNAGLPNALEVSPYVMHDILVFHEDGENIRVRLGYQHTRLDFSRTGMFDTRDGTRTVAMQFDARFRNEARLARVAVNLTDSRGRGGYEVELGIAAGTKRTFIFFMNFGGFVRVGKLVPRE
jgi:hypothetical protein